MEETNKLIHKNGKYRTLEMVLEGILLNFVLIKVVIL